MTVGKRELAGARERVQEAGKEAAWLVKLAPMSVGREQTTSKAEGTADKK